MRVSRVLGLSSVSFLGAACLLTATTEPAHAVTEFFAYGSGASIQTERMDDDLINPQEIKDWEPGWQLGAGLRIHSANVRMVGGKPMWEARIRAGYLQGKLADVQYEYSHLSDPVYDVSTLETADVTGVTIGATVVSRLTSSLGVFVGPMIERVKLKADYTRKWNGTVPDYYNGTIYGGDREADAEGTAIYGSLEVGARVEPAFSPLALEVFWVPRRVRMSTNQIVDEDAYKADFADLNAGIGLRASYDF
ncbi:MAG: hypothetical protein KDA27_16290 [Candidatus Eisenbacteria bacterium]|uniref:Outer membrane protein beta-barrel domain-containing protein n=1 Tax=Eiseniibacteriota bacterium TaxID=2212470 RepID=A0A956NHY1_UNCEI|nr:hypothetical protein [Candidatus Eisenbacteria bacterium]MCB9464510.1 hypothetical protein [Candidatus Eisenbacteria bacterium]